MTSSVGGDDRKDSRPEQGSGQGGDLTRRCLLHRGAG